MTGIPRTALVTGSAGFIGYHLCQRLLADGFRVTGLDAMTPYYDVKLKERRHALLSENPKFSSVLGRIEVPGVLAQAMAEAPEIVVHLAAQAGVRYSLEAPRSYLEANLAGTFELLEAAKAQPPKHLLLASTSSVYGANAARPYAETQKADWPLSFYAATKKANEAMAHAYAHLHGLPITLFRFFTVYGPWGRPDMALFKFTKAILAGETIEVYNRGEMARDFTYIDDLVEGVRRLIDTPPPPPGTNTVAVPGDSLSPAAPYRIVNIGNSAPVRLNDFIAAVEAAAERKAKKELLPMQAGDVRETWADIGLITALTGYRPKVGLDEGIRRFVSWYREFYGA